jgi:cytochrome oxidase Cu insertion factor (SCO1/SenC/PrrC family)
MPVTFAGLLHHVFMLFKRLISAMLLAMFLLVESSVGQLKPYPQPQTASATGQPAPDFSLRDQNGNNFTLSQQRGTWVLLYFYRGYW